MRNRSSATLTSPDLARQHHRLALTDVCFPLNATLGRINAPLLPHDADGGPTLASVTDRDRQASSWLFAGGGFENGGVACPQSQPASARLKTVFALPSNRLVRSKCDQEQVRSASDRMDRDRCRGAAPT